MASQMVIYIGVFEYSQKPSVSVLRALGVSHEMQPEKLGVILVQGNVFTTG